MEKECYGYIPCIQLSVCWYYLGDIEKKRFSIIVRQARINLTEREFLKISSILSQSNSKYRLPMYI